MHKKLFRNTGAEERKNPTRKLKKTTGRYVWILLEKIKCPNCRTHETLMTVMWLRTALLFYTAERNSSNASCTVA